jgi:6-phosphogluconolactonase (cycloisomerase 2 family)
VGFAFLSVPRLGARRPGVTRQRQAHLFRHLHDRATRAHPINLDAGNRFAYAADLGLDKVLIYRFGSDEGCGQHFDAARGSEAPAPA